MSARRSRPRAPLLAAAAALAALAALPAQERRAPIPRRPGKSTSTELHAAWIKEVLDLDPQGAIQDYDRIRKQAPRSQPVRWLAVTRMLELARLGVASPEPSGLPANAPRPVQQALSELQTPVPIGRLLSEPYTEIELPPLRAATLLVQDWVRNQIGPTVQERLAMRERRGDTEESRTAPDAEQQERLRLYYASQVLRVTLEGRTPQARAMRLLDFADWTPPAVDGDPTQVVARARRRLDEWIEADESSWLNVRLRDLKKHLDTTEDSDGQVVALLQQLPIIGDRLLAAEARGR